MSDAFRCIFGPRLYRIYTNRGKQHRAYEPSNTEFIGDKMINLASYAYSMTVMASPFIGYFMLKKGFFTLSGIISLAQFGISCFFILAGSYCIRGYGRLTNFEYHKFLKVLKEAQKPNHQHTARESMALYDFQFSSWPVDFRWDESHDKKKRGKFEYNSIKREHQGLFGRLFSFPARVARYIVAHYFARPLMYPGSVKMLQNLMAEALNDGRSSLVAKDGWRAKLKARDNNEIDTMFVDRRSSGEENGQILVIGCEGNAAFYEVGTIHTPLNVGYSVLGWNHPGFGGSSGLPYPEAERNAIDVVLKYAIERLGFPIENIVISAWSIGGYSGSWAAMIYPDIKGLILDATFDTITPLAVERMPQMLSTFTKNVINDYFPLFIHEHISKYSGPVFLYRRTRDEMISVIPGNISTNRGNYLMIELLRSRYPNLITSESLETLNSFLSAEDKSSKAALSTSLGIDDEECELLLKQYKEKEGSTFPCQIGEALDESVKSKLLVYLMSRYMIDFETTHCTVIPPPMFKVPQSV